MVSFDMIGLLGFFSLGVGLLTVGAIGTIWFVAHTIHE